MSWPGDDRGTSTTERPSEVVITVAEAAAGGRLDNLLAATLSHVSRAAIKQLVRDGAVRVEYDGRWRRARTGERLVRDARIRVQLANVAALPDPALSLCVVHEDEALVIVDKPAGVPSAPIAMGEIGCIANALLARYPEMADVGYVLREPGICHRLDTNTSGLLLAARNAEAFAVLVAALRDGALEKRYLAVCLDGGIRDSGAVTTSLRHGPQRVELGDELAANPTHYRVLARSHGVALVEARAKAAFRHQVRAHLASLGSPLVGDVTYGAPPHDLGRHALHASYLALGDTTVTKGFVCESALPPKLAQLLA